MSLFFERLLSLAFGTVHSGAEWYVRFLIRMAGIGVGLILTTVILVSVGLLTGFPPVLALGQLFGWLLILLGIEVAAPVALLIGLFRWQLDKTLRQIVYTMGGVGLFALLDGTMTFVLNLATFPHAFVLLHALAAIAVLAAALLRTPIVKPVATFALGWCARAAVITIVAFVLVPRFVPERVRLKWTRDTDRWIKEHNRLSPVRRPYGSLREFRSLEKFEMAEDGSRVPLLFYCAQPNREGPERFPIADRRGPDRYSATCTYAEIDVAATEIIETYLQTWEREHEAARIPPTEAPTQSPTPAPVPPPESTRTDELASLLGELRPNSPTSTEIVVAVVDPESGWDAVATAALVRAIGKVQGIEAHPLASRFARRFASTFAGEPGTMRALELSNYIDSILLATKRTRVNRTSQQSLFAGIDMTLDVRLIDPRTWTIRTAFAESAQTAGDVEAAQTEALDILVNRIAQRLF